ncbi:MAG: Hsp20/alpha crystallin family protein, partial [Nitrososphaerota archaeon]|nr:Hsp20/alpha crystallin family protein [Nitrososphaerota archaeon]
FGSPWAELGEPSIDIQDRGDHYVVTAELPGFDKKDVEVSVSDNTLELRGEKRTENESEEGGVSQALSSSSYLQRRVNLPDLVVSEKVSGTMNNGVLELRLPKREPKAQEGSRKVDLK